MAAFMPFPYGKENVKVNLKHEKGVEIVQKIVEKDEIDVFLDPFRPGVLEKLKLGPEVLMKLNPKLVYARISGFGQTGPMKSTAGHDINYVATSGVLSFLGSKSSQPKAPINLLADFAGGSVLCSLGIVMALFERTKSGKGQVLDHSMTEGTAYISSFLFETLKNQKDILWPNHPQAESNLLDNGAPFYRCYETKDNKFMAVGAIEVKFYEKFLEIIEFNDPEDKYSQLDSSLWPEMSEKIAEIMKRKTRSEWTKLFSNVDACVTPVLDVHEVQDLPLHRTRNSFSNGLPNPAPLMSRTPGERDWNISQQTKTKQVLQMLGYSDQDIQQFQNDKLIS